MSSQPGDQAVNGVHAQMGCCDGQRPSSPPPKPFYVDVRAERDHVRVAAVGELDLATAGPLDDTLRELDEAGTDRLVLDLRQLTFLDCTGLRSLLMAHARAAETGTELQVLCRPGPVSRLLALACADQTLDVVVSPAAVDPPAAITITDARA